MSTLESIKSANFPTLEGLYPEKDYTLLEVVVSTYGGLPEYLGINSHNLVTLGLTDLFENNQFYYVRAYNIISDNSVCWEYCPILIDDSSVSSEDGVIFFMTVPYMFSTIMFQLEIYAYPDGIVQIENLNTVSYSGLYVVNEENLLMSAYIFMKHFLLYAIDSGLSYNTEGGSCSYDLFTLLANMETFHSNTIEVIRQDLNTSIQNLENALVSQMNLDKNQLISELSNLNISLPENIDFTESLNGTFGSLKDGTRVQILLEDGLTYSSTIYEILRSSMVFADDKLYVVLYTLQDETNGSITLNTIDRMKLYVEPESEG